MATVDIRATQKPTLRVSLNSLSSPTIFEPTTNITTYSKPIMPPIIPNTLDKVLNGLPLVAIATIDSASGNNPQIIKIGVRGPIFDETPP